MAEVKRATRVAGRLREELVGIFRELRDPRVAGVMLSRVEVTDDLQIAKVYVRHQLGLAEGAEGDAAKKTMLKGLEAASGRIRREIAHALNLRLAPNFRFYYDDAPDEIARIEELLREVKGDGQKS